MYKFFIVIYSAIFYLLFVGYSLIAIPVMSLIVSSLVPFIGFRLAMKKFRRTISHYGWVIINILPLGLIRIDYKDLDDGDKKSPFIFVANHRSASDPFLMACLPYECIQVVNTWPFRLPILGKFASWAGYLSVKELSFDEFKARASKLLSQGVSIIAFPEGTRSGSKQMGQFHGAIFRVAIETNTPVVPISIIGNQNTPLKGSFLVQPSVIKIRRLKTVRAQDYNGWSAFKLKNYVRGVLSEYNQNQENNV
jgi:1-acyl-sn-glycerol-3-phosphate acyltransferase